MRAFRGPKVPASFVGEDGEFSPFLLYVHLWFARYWDLVRKPKSQDDCVEWKGQKRRDGYAVIQLDGDSFLAHRIFYAHWAPIGVDPWPEHVHHECGNRGCVNLLHLRGLTAAEHRAIHLGGGAP